jgi:hypothetical protein
MAKTLSDLTLCGGFMELVGKGRIDSVSAFAPTAEPLLAPLNRFRRAIFVAQSRPLGEIEPMTTLAFVAGILLGGKAGLFLALYVRGMGTTVAG